MTVPYAANLVARCYPDLPPDQIASRLHYSTFVSMTHR